MVDEEFRFEKKIVVTSLPDLDCSTALRPKNQLIPTLEYDSKQKVETVI